MRKRRKRKGIESLNSQIREHQKRIADEKTMQHTLSRLAPSFGHRVRKASSNAKSEKAVYDCPSFERYRRGNPAY